MTLTTSKAKAGRPKGSGGGKAPPLTPQQLKTLFRVTAAGENGTRNCALLAMLACGMRVSEPLSLRVDQVQDLRGKVGESFVLAAEHSKSKKNRRVYLNEQARKMLAEWITHSGCAGSDLIFPITANYATTLVKTLLHNAGIKATSHSLRRTAATQMSNKGIAVRHIQEVLGHSSLHTTTVYLSCDPSNTAKAVSAVEW